MVELGPHSFNVEEQQAKKQTHDLSKTLIKFIVFQQETHQELTLLSFD